jgi:hypothetical protein
MAVFDAPCGSHFLIQEGEVDWLAASSRDHSARFMKQQMARHVADSLRNLSDWERLRRWVFRLFQIASVRIYALVKADACRHVLCSTFTKTVMIGWLYSLSC